MKIDLDTFNIPSKEPQQINKSKFELFSNISSERENKKQNNKDFSLFNDESIIKVSQNEKYTVNLEQFVKQWQIQEQNEEYNEEIFDDFEHQQFFGQNNQGKNIQEFYMKSKKKQKQLEQIYTFNTKTQDTGVSFSELMKNNNKNLQLRENRNLLNSHELSFKTIEKQKGVIYTLTQIFILFMLTEVPILFRVILGIKILLNFVHYYPLKLNRIIILRIHLSIIILSDIVGCVSQLNNNIQDSWDILLLVIMLILDIYALSQLNKLIELQKQLNMSQQQVEVSQQFQIQNTI